MKKKSLGKNMYRVFISYSHEDRPLAQELVEILKDNGLMPLWDENFAFGQGFTEQIKNYIAHAHVFMPIITKDSSQRGWVHQEIGYAMALHVPVLPVTKDQLPGEMLQHLHAISLSENREILAKQLAAETFSQLVQRSQRNFRPMFECAEHPEDRTQLMIEYAVSVLELGATGKVRQKGGLSSFHIPDNHINHSIWLDRYGPYFSEFRCRLQRQERQWLEKHVRQDGCALILDPHLNFDRFGPLSKTVRLHTIVSFLVSLSDEQAEVALVKPSQQHREHHLTIIGDWFMAEAAYASKGKGIRQTIFSRHAPSIQSRIESFDEELSLMLKESPVGAKSSREASIVELCRILQQEVSGILAKPEVLPEVGREAAVKRIEEIFHQWRQYDE